MKAALRANGVTSMTVMGGISLTECLDPAMAVGVDDLRALVAMVDAAGINRAAGFGYLHSLAETGAKRGAGLPWTKEAEAFALAVVLSGVRGDPPGEIPPASAEAIAAAVEPFSNWDAMAKAGIHGAEQLVAVAAHRLLGAAAAAAPMMKRLEAMSITYLESAKKLLGVPFEPYVSPPVPERVLSAEEASVVAELERVLGELGVDAMERESKAGTASRSGSCRSRPDSTRASSSWVRSARRAPMSTSGS